MAELWEGPPWPISRFAQKQRDARRVFSRTGFRVTLPKPIRLAILALIDTAEVSSFNPIGDSE